jgi:pyruvate carboxylase
MKKILRVGVPSITGCSPIVSAVLKCDEVAYSVGYVCMYVRGGGGGGGGVVCEV